jgi:hypothetical protein
MRPTSRISISFTRWSTKLAPGEVVDNGYDLLVGMGEQFRGENAYDSTGVWSGSENAKFVYRQVVCRTICCAPVRARSSSTI